MIFTVSGFIRQDEHLIHINVSNIEAETTPDALSQVDSLFKEKFLLHEFDWEKKK